MVEFNPNTLNLNDPAMLATLADINFQDLDLQTMLTQIPPAWIKRAFPTHNGTPQSIITDLGKAITLPDMSNVFTINFDNESDRENVLSFLENHDAVIFAEKEALILAGNNAIDNASFSPENENVIYSGNLDPYMAVLGINEHDDTQWNLYNIGQYDGRIRADIMATDAWFYSEGSQNTRLGILDVGIFLEASDAPNFLNWEHEDLIGRSIGVSGIKRSDQISDINQGIAIAGIIGANTDNAIGIAGIDKKTILVADTLGLNQQENYSSILDLVKSDVQAINHGWFIFENDGVTPANSTLLRRAFAYAYKNNVVNVVAMGDRGDATVQYPAGFGQGVIAVGASTRNDFRLPSSSYGDHLDLVAPGSDIITTYRDGNGNSNYKLPGVTGTVYAAAHVTGTIGLMLAYAEAQGITLYNDDIEQLLNNTALHVSLDEYNYFPKGPFMGNGRLGAFTAIESLNLERYIFYQGTEGGGSATLITSQAPQIFYDAEGLPTDLYDTEVYEVVKTVTFPYIESPKVWVRGVETKGWNFDGEENFTMGWGEVSNVTSTSATVKTYVYHVHNPNGGGYLGWYPVAPQDVEIAFTAWGANLQVRAPSNLAILNEGGLAEQPQLSWIDPNTNGYTTAFDIYRCEGGSGSETCSNYTLIGSTTTTNYTDTFVYMVPAGWADGRFFYKVRASNVNGTSGYSSVVSTTGISSGKTGSGWTGEEGLPTEFNLSDLYPNPFVNQVSLRIALPTDAQLSVTVYDILGREVGQVINASYPAGYHDINWQNDSLPNGMYLCRIEVNEGDGNVRQITQKLVKVR